MKILIVDDFTEKIDMLKCFVRANSAYPFTIESAVTYESARTFLDEFFDIVIVDNYLDDNKLGVDFLTDYKIKWMDSFCFLYSSDKKKVNQELVTRFRCYSVEELQIELLQLIMNITNPRVHPYASEETMQTLIGSAPYNEKVCENLHKENDKDHARIESNVEKLADKIDKGLGDISIKLDASNNQGKNTFWAMVVFGGGVMGTCITVVLKVFN